MRTRLGVPRCGVGAVRGNALLALSVPGRQSAQSFVVGRLIGDVL